MFEFSNNESWNSKKMSLRKYSILLKIYLKEVKPIKYSELTTDGSLMDYLLEEEKYLYKFADILRLYLKDTCPEPRTHEFITMAKYNQMIDSMLEKFIRSEIMKIVSKKRGSKALLFFFIVFILKYFTIFYL